MADVAAAKAPEAKAAVDDARMAETLAELKAIKDAADSGQDGLRPDAGERTTPKGNAMLQAAVDALVAQTRAIEQVVAALDLEIEVEGSDSLDNPALVVQ